MRTCGVRCSTWVQNPYRLWASCSGLRPGIHVALPPMFIYVEAVTSRINPFFFLFLTTSVVSPAFPFCKLHNLSFEVLVILPSQEFVPLCGAAFDFLCFNYAFYSFCLTIFSSKLLHLVEIKCIKHEGFSPLLCLKALGVNKNTDEKVSQHLHLIQLLTSMWERVCLQSQP